MITFKLHVTLWTTCRMSCCHPRKPEHAMIDIFLEQRNIMYTDGRMPDNMQFYAVQPIKFVVEKRRSHKCVFRNILLKLVLKFFRNTFQGVFLFLNILTCF